MSSIKNKIINNKIKNNNLRYNLSTINKYKIQKYKNNIYFNNNLSICIHCYNIDIFEEIMYYINNFFEFKWKSIQIIIHFINYSRKEIEYIIEKVMKKKLTIKNCDCFIFIKGENIGIDIGGFLKCLNYIKKKDDIIIKIHTKSNDIWRKSMMNIFSIDGIYTSINLLKQNNIGMIGSLFNIEHFRKKYNPQFNINQYYIPMIQNLCQKINIEYNEYNLIQSYFVAGTIFLCKRELLDNIINNNNIIYDLCLDLKEKKWITGKMSKTYEHAMEIMFGYIPFHTKKYLIGLF